LIQAKQQGYRACVLFVVQLDFAEYFTLNALMDPKFAEALTVARQAGVEIYAYGCQVKEDEVFLDQPMEVR
jgi:sugar fermentation stimulation protein A